MRDDLTLDWFPDGQAPGETPDPMRAAQHAMRPPLPKRFYATAAVVEGEGGYVLQLDGRTARTPAKRPLSLPTRRLGESVVAEWQAQGAQVNPATMPLTRLANAALDGVTDERAAVVQDLLKYAGSDLICYRAGEPDRLVQAQGEAWDPILAWARDALGAVFVLSEGVMFVRQPAQGVEALRRWLETVASPFQLAALHVMTTLTGSVLIAAARAQGRLTDEEAWAAAHADELYQESVWGTDEEALARRVSREADFRAAARMFAEAGQA